jgi:hypothetical protein
MMSSERLRNAFCLQSKCMRDCRVIRRIFPAHIPTDEDSGCTTEVSRERLLPARRVVPQIHLEHSEKRILAQAKRSTGQRRRWRSLVAVQSISSRTSGPCFLEHIRTALRPLQHVNSSVAVLQRLVIPNRSYAVAPWESSASEQLSIVVKEPNGGEYSG